MSDQPQIAGRRLRSWVRWMFAALVLMYAVVCIGYAVLQRRLIYVPPHFTAPQMDAYAKNNGLERWNNSSGQAIGLKRLSPDQPATNRVLIFYGAGGSTIGSVHYVDDIQKIGAFDVFVLEYPGYADRAGLPSQQS